MRVVFMGTPAFAVPSLERLVAEHDVVAVYTRPDTPSRRGSALVPSPVKERACELGLDVRQPSTLRGSSEATHLASLGPEVIVVAAFGLILPPAILGVPRHGAVNVHASLLPRWRGAAPVQRAILAGDELTGVSIMLMEEGLDTGPYAEQVPVQVGEHDVASLTTALAQIGADALSRVLVRIADGSVSWIPQDESHATYAGKITREDVTPDPSNPPDEIVRKVRASSPSAPARIAVGDRKMTLLACRVAQERIPAGHVSCAPDGLLLGARGGAVLATVVKPDGRHEMPGEACGRGLQLSEETRWVAA